jgi:hypothetical protein
MSVPTEEHTVGLPDAAKRLGPLGLSYQGTWAALLAGRLVGHRSGRFWRIDAESLKNFERELARERDLAAR